MKRRVLSTLLLFALLSGGAQAVASQRTAGREAEVLRGSLEEIKGRQRVALLVSRSLVVDARDPARVAVDDYRKALAGSPPRTHTPALREIAQKLNKYILKYRSATATEEIADANLVVLFKVTAHRPSAGAFAWGKMYVLAVGRDHTPRVVWESSGDNTSAGDAA